MSRNASARGTRRARTIAAALRQVRLLQQVATGSSSTLNSPHYFVKHHALNCGQPHCRFCTNPRHNPWNKSHDRLTRQELKAQEAERLERRFIGVYP